MRFVDRIRYGWKAFRFSGSASQGWAAFLNRTSYDYAKAVGDGTKNSIVVAALTWIARNFPEAPVRVREFDPEGELVSTTNDGAVRMVKLIARPNAFLSGPLLWMATVIDYWVNGNAVWVKVRGGPGGAVTELWWVPWTLIKPKWPESGNEFISHYEYKPDGSTTIKVPVEDVVHFRFGLDPDNIRVGRTPLTSAIREVFTDDEAANFSAALVRNMGVPGLVIIPPDGAIITPEDADTIKDRAKQTFGGDNRGDPLVMSANSSVQVLSFSPEQMNLRELRKLPEERVTAVLGVPAIVAGLGAGLDRSTFANYSEAREAAYEENIIPTQRLFAATIDTQLLPDFVGDDASEGYATDFDISKVRVLQEDQNALWARAGDAAAKGLITLAEFRTQIGLPVDDDLHNVYLRPFNVVEVPEEHVIEDPNAEEEEPEEEPVVEPVEPVEDEAPEDEDEVPVEVPVPA
jgi:HK97 family phage portal protein